MLASLPEPKLPSLETPYTMLVTGVGGTGVVTLSAVLGQAAHLEGMGFGSIDMTGLAQKGGAVACHMRVARDAEQIHAIRAGVAGADLVLGCDLVVTASNKVLETIKPDHTAVVYSNYEMATADFTRNANLKVPGAALQARHRGAGRQGARARLRRPHHRREAVRRLHCRQHVHPGLRLSSWATCRSARLPSSRPSSSTARPSR